jgi:hypothetical protein
MDVGGTINVTAATGLKGGIYTLLSSTGAMTIGSLSIGSKPANYLITIDGTSSSREVRLIVMSPVQQWQALHFGPNFASNPLAALNANPSGDGISNLVKYALGLDPSVSAVSGLPKVEVDRDRGILTLTYTKAISATDVAYIVIWSDSFDSWSSNGVTEELVSDDGVIQTVRAKVALGPGVKRFIRLQVNQL